MAVLITPLAAQSATDSSDMGVGREVAIPHHLQDGEEFDISVQDLSHTERSFSTRTSRVRKAQDGRSPKVPERHFPIQIRRSSFRATTIGSPDRNRTPAPAVIISRFPAEGADLSSNVFVLGQRFDFATFDANDVIPTHGTMDERGRAVTLQSIANSRATPDMFGSGYVGQEGDATNYAKNVV